MKVIGNILVFILVLILLCYFLNGSCRDKINAFFLDRLNIDLEKLFSFSNKDDVKDDDDTDGGGISDGDSVNIGDSIVTPDDKTIYYVGGLGTMTSGGVFNDDGNGYPVEFWEWSTNPELYTLEYHSQNFNAATIPYATSGSWLHFCDVNSGFNPNIAYYGDNPDFPAERQLVARARVIWVCENFESYDDAAEAMGNWFFRIGTL